MRGSFQDRFPERIQDVIFVAFVVRKMVHEAVTGMTVGDEINVY